MSTAVEEVRSSKEVAVSPNDSKPDSEHGSSDYYIDPVKESRMMRKFDIFAVTAMGFLYLMSNLDRSNLGNANIAGLPEELNLVGNQFGTATTLLFATYVPLEGPVAVLLKVIGPKPIMAISAFCWGSATLGMSFVKDYRALYACRLLIGLFEAGLIPCINVYLGWVYKKSERGKRSSMIFAFSAFSSAFGGILAYGLTQIRTDNFSGWRWLFAIEGAMTFVIVPCFYFVFPKSPTEAWFLTAEEKQMMQARYDADPSWGNDEEFSWAECFKAFKDPKWWAFWAYQFSVNISLYGLTTFLPTIVRGLGYTSVHANLMTVPIYICSLLFFLVIAYFSDRTQMRGPYLLGCLMCLIIGYAILISVENLKVRFFACFLAALGIYPTTGLSTMWLQDNAAKHYKRATMVGFMLCLGNTAGVAVGQIFTTPTAPRYIHGLSVAMGLAAFAGLIVVVLMVSFTVANRRRAARLLAAEHAGTPIAPNPDLGDYCPHFKYSI